MKGSPSLCVVDANVLIDLHIGGLLRESFLLPLRLGVITQPQAAQALERMLVQSRRLPRAECQKRLQQWGT